MAAPPPLEMTLLPGARELLALHARELPQRDDLCGAFCGALALRAAGIERTAGEPLDQDAVALAAGSVVSARQRPRQPAARRNGPARLPPGAAVRRGRDRVGHHRGRGGRRDRAARRRERSRAIPYSGPWTRATLDGLFDAGGRAGAPGDAGRQPRHPPPVGWARARRQLLDYLSTASRRPAARLGRGALRVRRRPRARPARQPVRRRRHLPVARQRRRAPAAARSVWRRRSSGATCPRAA